MKSLYVGAAALLLGTSALAGAMVAKEDPSFGGLDEGKPFAGATVNEGFGPVPAKEAQPLKAAQVYAGEYDEAKGGGDAYAYQDPAQLDPVDPALTGDPAGTGAPVDTIDTTTQLGETTPASAAPVQTVALDLSPRPATQNYPACEPGPGDDSCIQLYEPGVRTALASWSGTTGGLAGAGETQTAMGGPEEPLPAETAMTEPSADAHYADQAPVETAMTEPDPAVPAAEGTAYTGVGGPTEAATGYPPCSGAASDDRCIQLYERGVTGEGN